MLAREVAVLKSHGISVKFSRYLDTGPTDPSLLCTYIFLVFFCFFSGNARCKGILRQDLTECVSRFPVHIYDFMQQLYYVQTPLLPYLHLLFISYVLTSVICGSVWQMRNLSSCDNYTEHGEQSKVLLCMSSEHLSSSNLHRLCLVSIYCM